MTFHSQGKSIQFYPEKFFSCLYEWQGASLQVIIYIFQYSAVTIANKVNKSDEAARSFKIIKGPCMLVRRTGSDEDLMRHLSPFGRPLFKGYRR